MVLQDLINAGIENSQVHTGNTVAIESNVMIELKGCYTLDLDQKLDFSGANELQNILFQCLQPAVPKAPKKKKPSKLSSFETHAPKSAPSSR